ncbi:MAG: DNA helicase Rep [Gammaproteobacteria bacterium]|jgi:ATP-dependent DNA helicase Rep|nr:DNA helicase Rep [Gammaproteobacteria bacterium]MBT5826310.1 DNA helicase Rep [Gammaproteobacteria bacterium]MBT5965766.1 DNA helicase Rep [Gammaproteobacteria bacterium]MBT6420156.1 DNA helicase Rep [Gammaproteobacteria bacterium]MBT7435994.1 DNA helicase Rep [Gammaproteobacteria bacterium]
MPQLNSEQARAVKTIDRPLLVLAGAGSGKTRVITEKIAHLVKQGLPARHIAALTFTNKAAREMKARVGKLLDDKQLRGLRVSTFHSLGLDILRKEHQTLQYKSGISLFDEQDKITLLKNLITHGSAHYDIDEVDNYSRKIGQWKNAFITPEQALSHASEEEHIAAQIYTDYIRSLKAYNAVDFDDLILLPVLLFQKHSEVLEKWQNKIRYLLVDEYQDTNITQYQLVKLLVGRLGKFTVVGDDDQSIYAWRGAQPENLAQLQQDYDRLTVIKLEQNYRSYGRILNVANQLIANNPHAFEKKLWSDMGYGEPLRVLTHKNDATEAKQIVSEIVHHKFKTGADFGDYAILYRGNHQSRLFEHSLREHDVPYFINGSTSFFSYAEIKDILSYLKLFVNPDDDAAFLRIVNTPRREIGPTTLEKLGAYANERQISLFSACSQMGAREKLPQAALARLQKFCEWTGRTASAMQSGDTFAEMHAFIEQINYHQWLQENSNTQQAAERKIKNVSELLEWLERLAKSEDNSEAEKTLDEIVSKIQLIDIMDRNQEDQADNQVSLMTLHAAKGLEFPHVFLIGIEENILPHKNSIDSDNIEEERRLAYVGITRAQQTCTFSYCTHRKRYGDITESSPSRFLAELPEEDLEWPSKNPVDEAEQKVRGKANLAHLKSMLS